MQNKEIVIKTARCTLVILEGELFKLLAMNPVLFENCIRRGKMLLRCQAAEARAAGELTNNPWYSQDD